MAMISYAQNREDVLLRRAFPQNEGFYIDVGAADPVYHSVTKCFSNAGWTGINIEPLLGFYERIVADRPRDINLNLAASDCEGEISLFEVPSCIGWATIDPLVSQSHQRHGVDVVPRTVRTRTLNEICRDHVTSTIDFLKIDVEGAEKTVLEGIDLRIWRPRIIVVEATEVNSQQLNHDSWEHLITDYQYQYATFDGLNRYYVRDEDRHLIDQLITPVNVFDDYVLHQTVSDRAEIQSAQTRIAELERELNECRAELALWNDASFSVSNARNTKLAHHPAFLQFEQELAKSRNAGQLTSQFLEETRAQFRALQERVLQVA